MVKFTQIALGFVVLLAAMGAGIVVGMQLGGGAETPQASEPGTGGDGSSGGATATPTATPTNGTSNATATPTATGSQTPTATPTPTTDEQEPYVPPSHYDEAELERKIAELINERRQERSLDPMSTTGTTADQLQTMARNHSVAMGQEGATVHEIDGVDTRDRYENSDLYETCEFQPEGKAYSKNPDSSFEALGQTVAGRPYGQDGEQFNAGTMDVAETIVDDWFSTSVYRDRLTYANTARMGVGVNVTSSGDVYVTVDVCG